MTDDESLITELRDTAKVRQSEFPYTAELCFRAAERLESLIKQIESLQLCDPCITLVCKSMPTARDLLTKASQ